MHRNEDWIKVIFIDEQKIRWSRIRWSRSDILNGMISDENIFSLSATAVTITILVSHITTLFTYLKKKLY